MYTNNKCVFVIHSWKISSFIDCLKLTIPRPPQKHLNCWLSTITSITTSSKQPVLMRFTSAYTSWREEAQFIPPHFRHKLHRFVSIPKKKLYISQSQARSRHTRCRVWSPKYTKNSRNWLSKEQRNIAQIQNEFSFVILNVW